MTQCTVCAHEQRSAIESALARRTPLTVLGRKFALTPSALCRHRKNHMSEELRAALQLGMAESDIDLDELRKERSENFLLRIMSTTGRLQSLADRLEEDGDLRGAANVYGKIQAWTELEGRFLGDLNAATLHVRHSFVRSHEWSKLKAVFVRELRDHPELAQRILAAMRAIQDEAQEPAVLLENKNGASVHVS